MSSGIYSALSGLTSIIRKVGSTANNVANVNTPGFKASKVNLQSGPTQSLGTAAGPANLGRDAEVGSIATDFTQGTFAGSANPTDMAIGGQGFFILRSPGSQEADSYSRVGGFNFDQHGNLTNATGALVQGWQVDPASGERVGNIGDINLGKTTEPVATEQVDLIANLDAHKPIEDNPVSLFKAWDGRNAAASPATAPIDSSQFEYATSIKVYDSQGGSHDLTAYFDRTENPNQWEILVTADPLTDQRQIPGPAPQDQMNAAEHKGAGALLYGRINFNTAGEIESITAYDVPPDGTLDPAAATDRLSLGSGDSYYSFAFNPTGAATNGYIELNLGARFSGQGSDFEPEALSTTQYASPSSTIFQKQDGFTAGFLQSVAVNSDGVISGSYSNGQVIPRAQVALASFNNPGGLSNEGQNMFRATSDSGPAITGSPGTIGLGSVAPNALEQSNVELAREIPNLIISKRFFQANLKIIQVEDEMLGNLLDIKS